MATAKEQHSGFAGASNRQQQEEVHVEAGPEVINKERLKIAIRDATVTIGTGILKVGGVVFMAVIAGVSAGIASERYKEYRSNKMQAAEASM